MFSIETSKSGLAKWFVFLLLFTVPHLLGDQKKKDPPPKGHTQPTQEKVPANNARPAPHGSTGTTTGGTHPSGGTPYTPAGATASAPGQTNPSGPGHDSMPRGTGGAELGRPGAGVYGGAPGRISTPHSATPFKTTRTFTDSSGRPGSVTYRPGGRLATVRANGMTINHGLHGDRTIVSRHNGQTIVSTGPRSGYVQRSYVTRNGQQYVQRTYVSNGVTRTAAYRSFSYGGVHYYSYAPVVYYRPAFYTWAFAPWVVPVHYGAALWGWAGTPWYGMYGGFFRPYPVYPMASLWLTDYLLALDLQAAYQAGLAAGQGYPSGYPQGYPPPTYPPNYPNAAPDQAPPGDYGAPPPDSGPVASNQVQLTPEVKQAIADQVQQQLQNEQSAAANPDAEPAGDQVPDALNPAERVFVVASPLDVTAVMSGQECSLTPGDVVTRLDDEPDSNQNVRASVQSAKKGDCAGGQTVEVSVQALQEMHNQFRQQVDGGLKVLAEKSGQNGLPAAPDTGTTDGEVPPPTPDNGVTSQLQAQQQQANQTEAQAQQQPPPPPNQ